MTWIIGLPTSFGYAAAISDTRVMWGTSLTHDCLLKVYPIGNNIAAGFAGSVELGFFMLDDLAASIRRSVPPGYSVLPRHLALRWQRRARWIFKQQHRDIRALGSSIMLVAVSPTEYQLPWPFPRADVIALESHRGFQPRSARANHCLSIGSGTQVPEYAAALEHYNSDVFPRLAFGTSFRHGLGRTLASDFARTLREHRTGHVGPHVHVTTVEPGRIEALPVNSTEYGVDGSVVEYKMPRVAVGYAEFRAFCRDHGLSYAQARA